MTTADLALLESTKIELSDLPRLAYGFHDRVEFSEYARIPALNYSTLKHMMRSPMSYKWHRDNPQPPTDAMQLGTAAHRVILEPDRVGDFAVWDGGRRYGKTWDAFVAEHSDRQILTAEQRDNLIGVSVAVRKCAAAKRYLAAGTSEISLLWRDKAAVRDFKGRIDHLLVESSPLIADLKTTRDCRPFKFGNEAYRLGYHMQAAMYADGYYYLTGKLPRVVIIAVENKPPYETAVYRVSDEILHQGHEDYMRLVAQLEECERSDNWPPALETETDLSLPTYAYGSGDDDLTDLQLIAE